MPFPPASHEILLFHLIFQLANKVVRTRFLKLIAVGNYCFKWKIYGKESTHKQYWALCSLFNWKYYWSHSDFLLKWEHRISSFDSFKYVFLLHWQVHVLLWYLGPEEIISTGSNVINRKSEWHSPAQPWRKLIIPRHSSNKNFSATSM